MGSIKSFSDLEAWQQAHTLAVKIYRVTQKFPASDKFGLVPQMQRSALSVSSNIAEGFGRESLKDARHFYIMARGSLTELQNQLLLAKDTHKLDPTTFKKLAEQSIVVHKLVNGILRSVSNQQRVANNQPTKKTK